MDGDGHRVAPRVQVFLDKIGEADEVTRVRSSLAISLAMKLDEAIADDSATSSMAVPSISKELRSALDELVSAQADKEEFVADLFKD